MIFSTTTGADAQLPNPFFDAATLCFADGQPPPTLVLLVNRMSRSHGLRSKTLLIQSLCLCRLSSAIVGDVTEALGDGETDLLDDIDNIVEGLDEIA